MNHIAPIVDVDDTDVILLAMDVACAVTMAKLVELQEQSFRLGEMVQEGILEKPRAVDMLYVAARAANLVTVHGDDCIQDIISVGFEVSA